MQDQDSQQTAAASNEDIEWGNGDSYNRKIDVMWSGCWSFTCLIGPNV
jgi:hypothetical protein